MKKFDISFTAVIFTYTALSFLFLLSLPTCIATGNFCGTSWMDAVGSCQRPCPTGAPTQCGAGETCFANTPCVQIDTIPPPPTPRPVVTFQPPQQQQQQQEQVTGSANTNTNTGAGATCGDGNRGNGLCSNQSECCSQYGHCGTTPAHCDYGVNNNDGLPPSFNTNTNTASGGVSNNGIAGTCGGGLVGNGKCPNPVECCSQYGFCGTTSDHCAVSSQQAGQPIGQPTSVVQTPQFNDQGVLVPVNVNTPKTPEVYGSCGGGNTGNGICPNNSECCSQHGFCGTSLEHCTDKVGPDFPGQSLGDGSSPAEQTQQQLGGFGPNPMEQQQQQQQPQMDNLISQQPQQPIIPSTVAPHGTNKKIIGYYAGWQWYDRDKLADPANMDFRKVQRVNYAFFQPDVMGNIFGTDRWGDPQVLFGPYSSKLGGGVQKCSYDSPQEVNCAYHEHNTGLIYQAHKQGAEVFPSIGGWTLSDNFPVMSADPVARNNFAKNCVDILTYHNFDGIDIDWEYPGYSAHSGTVSDTVNFTKMLAAIKAALETLTRSTGKEYGLTAAFPCNPDNIANIEVSKLATILTEFNLMSYDLHGSWDEVTGTNAPLYYQGFGNEEFNIHRCVEKYVALGVPRDRINIGLPFYGRSFKFATALNQNHGGNDLANWPDDEGTPQWFNIYQKLPFMTQLRDNKSKTQIAFTNPNDQFAAGFDSTDAFAESLPQGLVSFDDERAICDKVQYAQENDLAGFIIWELSGDILEDLRTPLLDITNAKLGNPSMQCCALHSEEECEKERLENDQMSNSQGFDMQSWYGNSQTTSGGSFRMKESFSVFSLSIAATAALLYSK